MQFDQKSARSNNKSITNTIKTKNPKIKPNLQTKSGGMKKNIPKLNNLESNAKHKIQPLTTRNKQLQPPKKSSEETRKILFEKSKQKAPLNTKLNQLKNKI